MQDVLGGNGFLADAALGERQVFGNGRVQVVAHHQHVHVFVQRVDGERARRVGGGGQHVGFAHHLENVGCVATAGALAVVGVNGAALEGGDGVFDKARFIECVGVNRHLHVGLLGNIQAVAYA